MDVQKLIRIAGLLSLSLLASFALMACGGDDDTGGSLGGGTGSDAKFVADICKAVKNLSTEIGAATKNVTAADADKIGEKLAEPYAKFADAFAKAKPPSDLKDWHEQASKSLKATADAIKKGDFSQVDGGDPFEALPAGASERLSKSAADNKDCTDAGASF